MPTRHARHLLLLLATLLLALPAALAQVEQFTSIVVFGDSLSDIGNVATLTTLKYGVAIPGPIADYTLGRFTDGPDTVPAARNDVGVWVEQLATLLPNYPRLNNSLAGGSNFAYAFAFTGRGTSLLTLSTAPPLAVTIDNIGLQITTFLATHPTLDRHTLFVVWGGANNVLNATSSTAVSTAAVQELANIQRLVHAGATQFLIPNLPPLGAIPRLNGSPLTSIPADQASVLFNTTLATGLDLLRLLDSPRHVALRQLDVFTLFREVLASPASFGFTNVTDSSRGLPTVDPDTYLFWDDLHPTTHTHNLIARAAYTALNQR